MKKRFLFPLLLVPIVGGVLWWSAAHTGKMDPAGKSRVVTVDRGPVKLVVMASGKISPNFEVDIKCKASGEVINLPFDISDFVKKGELVLELDPIDEQRLVDQQKAAKKAAEFQ